MVLTLDLVRFSAGVVVLTQRGAGVCPTPRSTRRVGRLGAHRSPLFADVQAGFLIGAGLAEIVIERAARTS